VMRSDFLCNVGAKPGRGHTEYGRAKEARWQAQSIRGVEGGVERPGLGDMGEPTWASRQGGARGSRAGGRGHGWQPAGARDGHGRMRGGDCARPGIGGGGRPGAAPGFEFEGACEVRIVLVVIAVGHCGDWNRRCLDMGIDTAS
jgi:hypothetical protein